MKSVPHYDDDVIMVEMVDGPILLHPSHGLITPEEGTDATDGGLAAVCPSLTLSHHLQ